MSWLIMFVRALFGRDQVESEMDREMRAHIEMEIEENIRKGMAPEEARRAAYVAFGGFEKAKESTRDERSTRLLEQLRTDLRYAGRGMRHRPGFTAAIVLLLALGIGANTALYSVVDELVWRRFPIPGGNRVVKLVVEAGNGDFEFDPPQSLVDAWQSRATLVEDIRFYRWTSATLGDTTRTPARELDGIAIGPAMMSFVSMKPVIGREISPADTIANAPFVVMIGEKLWRSDFGARSDVIGSTILLSGQPHRVIGVAPKDFFVPFAAFSRDFYVARRHEAKPRPPSVIAKLKPGHTLAEAQREAASIGTSMIETGMRLDPPKLKDASSIVRPSVKRLVLMLFGAVGIVLLIASANVANLLLARTWSRQREFAVRGAMGAGRSRIARQLFTENLLLALMGGAAGFLVAVVLLKVIVAVQPDNVGIGGRLDVTIFGWAMMISLLMGLLLAAAPTAMIGEGRLNDLLKSSVRSASAGTGARRLRSMLVVTEVALSVVLLVGSGLLIRSIAAMQHADVGLNPDGLASIAVRFPSRTFEEDQARRNARIAILDRIRKTPGITGATMAWSPVPDFAASLRGDTEIEGHAVGPQDSLNYVAFNLGTEDFFRVTGMRFIEGRPYDPAAGKSEVVINEGFARRYWPKGAIGKHLRIDSTWARVVGVVANLEIPGEKSRSRLQHYRFMTSAPPRLAVMVRSSLPAPALEAALTNAIKEVAPHAVTQQFQRTTARYVEARAVHRFTLGLVSAFAGLALFLAAIGLSAVIGYAVSQRMREIGIRIALGAQSSEVARLVLGQGVTLAVIGIVIGCLGGLAATRVMRSMLYGVTPGDPLTMISVAVLLVIVAVVACALPARRATRIDPVEMVRAE